MTLLVSGTGVPIEQGLYQYVVNITSGTVTFSISTDGEATYQPMTNGVISADEDGLMTMSNCYLKAVMSATATADINYVGKS